MEFSYFVMPFFAWLLTGIFKFLVNLFFHGRNSFKLVGYGGFPSNHSAIVSSCCFLIFLKLGIFNPFFCVAITYAFIVILDAASLRKQIGLHAKSINKIIASDNLRERIGHTKIEILGGILSGVLSAYIIYFFEKFFNI